MRTNPSATFAMLKSPEPTWSSKRQQNILRSEIDGSRTWWTNAKRLPWISTPRHLYLPWNALKPTPSQIHPLKMLSSLPISSQRSVPQPLHRWLSNSPLVLPTHYRRNTPCLTFHWSRNTCTVRHKSCAVSTDCLRPRVRVHSSHRVLREAAPALGQRSAPLSPTMATCQSRRTHSPTNGRLGWSPLFLRIGSKQKRHPTID